MTFKIFLLCVAFASVKAGVLHSALRYETPIIASAPAAIKYEIPPTSRVEHLAPVVTTSYGYSTVPLKHEVVAPAVKIAAPVLKVETPIAVAAPTIHVETPAITRVEHLAPAVASSYKTEVITAPKVHVTHTPAVAKIEHFPTIAKVEHVVPTLKTELLTAPVASHISIAQPALRYETPALAKIEHLAPSIASSFRTEVVSAPAVKLETSHLPLLHVASPTIAKVEHLSPAIHVASPIAKTEFISHPSLKIASFDHGLHGISLKHLGHESFVF